MGKPVSSANAAAAGHPRGVCVDDGRARHLEQRAQRLGFADLRGYLQARSDAGHSIPQLAAELGVSEWTVKRALTRAEVTLPPAAERLARQRRHATRQRLAARAAELGFDDVRWYLADRLLVRGLPLAELTAELGAHRRTVRRLMDEYGIRRVRRTPREQAAGERGRRAQAAAWQARRTARLAELGFADLAGYLQRRYVEHGWSVRRMQAELGVGLDLPPGGRTPRMRGCPHGRGTPTKATTDPSRVHQGVQARRGGVGPQHRPPDRRGRRELGIYDSTLGNWVRQDRIERYRRNLWISPWHENAAYLPP
jgi:AraC-like DNA-binding protein